MVAGGEAFVDFVVAGGETFVDFVVGLVVGHDGIAGGCGCCVWWLWLRLRLVWLLVIANGQL